MHAIAIARYKFMNEIIGDQYLITLAVMSYLHDLHGESQHDVASIM